MGPTNRDEISRLELLHSAHPEGLVFPHLADAYRRAGRYAEAESLLKTGIRRHPDYSSGYVVLGRLRLDQEKHPEAERSFERVLEIDPHNQAALEHLGRLLRRQGRYQDALSHFRRLARLEPNDEIEAEIGRLERRLAEGPAVAATRSPANGAGPAAPPAPDPDEVVTETMAELYLGQGLLDRAEAVYRQLLAAHPEDDRLRTKLRGVQERREAAAGSSAGGDGASNGATGGATPPQSGRGVVRMVEERASPTIGGQLQGLLRWRPAADPTVRRPPTHSDRRKPSRVVGGGNRIESVFAPERGRSASAATVARPTPRPGPSDGSRSRPASRSSPASTSNPPRTGTQPPALPASQGPLVALTDMLVGLLEYRDPFFRGSSSLTRVLAVEVGEALGLDQDERVDLALAAVLRDVGRLAMGGRLVDPTRPAPEVRRKVERHVELALELLDGLDLPEAVRLAVRHHHERWDGNGYPDGLAGGEIPRLARVVAVADSFTAMVSPRPWRLPRTSTDALGELRAEAGTRYDPEVVEAFGRLVATRESSRKRPVRRHHVLLVSPDQAGATITAAKLCSAGYLAEVVSTPDAAWNRLRRAPVAALVVSAQADPDAAVRFVHELRAEGAFSALPILVRDAATVALRVRLLEAGADICFPSEVAYAEVQGTLGALLRRSLGARTRDRGSGQQAPWLALQGDVQDFSLAWLLQVMKYDSRTAAIGVRTPDAEGAIYLRQGDPVHARIRGGEKGEPALRRMLDWREGRFTVRPNGSSREVTIDGSVTGLLLNHAIDEDHAAAGIFGAVSP